LIVSKSCSVLPPNERPSILETSKELEQAYELVAREGSSVAPDDAEDEVDYHYVCLVRSHRNGRLYELDGDRSGPIDRGDVRGPGDDLIAAGGLRVVQEYIERGKGNSNFNLMALVQD
jgi:ubiquitin carboxyl-terminal hydrolase L3